MEDKKYYVAVGASAGGLEALEQFFTAMPTDTGLVFVVIQHLSPDYKSLMDELLARYTRMPIYVAKDGMDTDPNSIYLIPPSKNLSIYHGKLYLEDQLNYKHLNLPIDVFFKSLAKDQDKRSIGIILSGTGSDGTLGCRAIKEAGGMVMVQDISTAKFDGMPRSAISTGLVDYVLHPSQMGKELLGYIRHPSIIDSLDKEEALNQEVDNITKICMIIRNFSSIDFSHYKDNTLIRRVERRIKVNRLISVEDYIDLLSSSDKEKDILNRELLIGVTSFFRDEDAFLSLKNNVLPNIDYSKGSIRIWSAGCSTGEEVYSLAILFNEYLISRNIDCEVKFFATDVDSKALEVASAGYYPDSIVADVGIDLISKYFDKRGDGYVISEKIRKTVVFANHNVLKDPPFSKIDLLVCRNLFIYIKAIQQQQILQSFYYSLAPSGYMFMGSSESVGEMAKGFESVDSKWKIYKYKKGYTPPLDAKILYGTERLSESIPIEMMNRSKGQGIKIEKLLSASMSATMPPSIILDRNDNIIHVINDVSPYIKLMPGRFTNNFNSLMPKELALFVNNILRRVRTDKKNITISNVSASTNPKSSLEIKGYYISEDSQDFYLISFVNVEGREEEYIELDMSDEARERVIQLEGELQLAREGLQATIEELETSNEELQSSNEELIASNEELQSTNEELQSVNEELYTVNNEYQSKIEELTKLNSDLSNLLKNTEVGALYLDKKLCIRKITPVVSRVTNIIESDIGRPISHISVMESYKDLLLDIDKVLDTLVGIEREIEGVDGKCWLTRIRPYRTEYNSVDGLIITFVDISSLKREREKGIVLEKRLDMAMEYVGFAWWDIDFETNITSFSNSKSSMLGYSSNDLPKNINGYIEYLHPNDKDLFSKTIDKIRNGEKRDWDMVYRALHREGHFVSIYDKGFVVETSTSGKAKRALGIASDISRLKEIDNRAKSNKGGQDKGE